MSLFTYSPPLRNLAYHLSPYGFPTPQQTVSLGGDLHRVNAYSRVFPLQSLIRPCVASPQYHSLAAVFLPGIQKGITSPQRLSLAAVFRPGIQHGIASPKSHSLAAVILPGLKHGIQLHHSATVQLLCSVPVYRRVQLHSATVYSCCVLSRYLEGYSFNTVQSSCGEPFRYIAFFIYFFFLLVKASIYLSL